MTRTRRRDGTSHGAFQVRKNEKAERSWQLAQSVRAGPGEPSATPGKRKIAQYNQLQSLDEIADMSF
jgi:hypothetical protein